MTGRGRRDSLTPEERHQRSVSARRKFKAIVRLIIGNLAWLQELEDDKLGDNVRKNIQVLTRKKGKKSLLTLQDKSILNKPPEDRTEEEMERLRQVLGRIKCFQHFPREIRNELPSICHFAYYGANRVLVKQDYEPLNMYVLLTGEVVVSQTFYSRLLKEDVSKDMMVLSAGTQFGEVSMLQNSNRLATITTTQASELLYIKRDDFERVLKPTMMQNWLDIIANLKRFSYFQNWPAYDVRDTCILAKKKSFKTDQMILSPTGGHHDCVYFVTNGSCYLLEYLTIKTEYNRGTSVYHLLPQEAQPSADNVRRSTTRHLKKLYKEESGQSLTMPLRPVLSGSVRSLTPSVSGTKVHYMKICTFNKLSCFNVGESLKNRIIVASEDTQCLLVPRDFLMERNLFMFQTVANFLRVAIPSTEKIFKIFLEEKKWATYKENLIRGLLRGKNPVNHIHNVPYTVRLGADLGGT